MRGWRCYAGREGSTEERECTSRTPTPVSLPVQCSALLCELPGHLGTGWVNLRKYSTMGFVDYLSDGEGLEVRSEFSNSSGGDDFVSFAKA